MARPGEGGVGPRIEDGAAAKRSWGASSAATAGSSLGCFDNDNPKSDSDLWPMNLCRSNVHFDVQLSRKKRRIIG